MKICFLTNNLNKGSGWGRYSREIIEKITKQPDIEASVLTEGESDWGKEKVILQNSFKNISFIFLNAVKARKHIKQCEIIHCLDGYPYGVIGALASLGLGKKLIISGVGTYSVAPLDQKIKGTLLKWAYRKAERILCISSFTEREILKRVKLENTQVIHMGINFDKFHKDKEFFKKGSDKIILSVGGLKRRKGYHVSIPAMRQVKKKYNNFKYYIVGDQNNKSYFKELKDIVKENKLENNIIFLEKISDDDLIKLYYQSDLFLLTPVNIGCHFEGFGLVYLEASACQKPIIGTYHCGAEDAIEDGFNGFLVPQNNVTETSKAILKILDNPVLAEKLGKNGEIKAKKMSWQNTAKKYIEIYEKFIKKE